MSRYPRDEPHRPNVRRRDSRRVTGRLTRRPMAPRRPPDPRWSRARAGRPCDRPVPGPGRAGPARASPRLASTSMTTASTPARRTASAAAPAASTGSPAGRARRGPAVGDHDQPRPVGAGPGRGGSQLQGGGDAGGQRGAAARRQLSQAGPGHLDASGRPQEHLGPLASKGHQAHQVPAPVGVGQQSEHRPLGRFHPLGRAHRSGRVDGQHDQAGRCAPAAGLPGGRRRAPAASPGSAPAPSRPRCGPRRDGRWPPPQPTTTDRALGGPVPDLPAPTNSASPRPRPDAGEASRWAASRPAAATGPRPGPHPADRGRARRRRSPAQRRRRRIRPTARSPIGCAVAVARAARLRRCRPPRPRRSARSPAPSGEPRCSSKASSSRCLVHAGRFEGIAAGPVGQGQRRHPAHVVGARRSPGPPSRPGRPRPGRWSGRRAAPRPRPRRTTTTPPPPAPPATTPAGRPTAAGPGPPPPAATARDDRGRVLVERQPAAHGRRPLGRIGAGADLHRQPEAVEQLGPEVALLRVHGPDEQEAAGVGVGDALALDPVDPAGGGVEQHVHQVVGQQVDLVDVEHARRRRRRAARARSAARRR